VSSRSTHTPACKALPPDRIVHYRPPHRSAFFAIVIVKAPVVQVISIVLAGFIIALEYSAPFLKGTRLHRSIILRIPLLLLQAFFAVLFYQVSPYLFVSAHGVSRSLMRISPL